MLFISHGSVNSYSRKIHTITHIHNFSAQVGNSNDTACQKAIKSVLAKCYLGDWFVLMQISKNTNMYFFRAFIKELKSQMIIKKKSSFKGSSKGNSLIKLSDNNGDIEKGVEIDDKSSLLLDKAPPITTV